MKKLLLVLLIPVLVLGLVIGCGNLETGSEVDAFVQGTFYSNNAAAGIIPGIGDPVDGKDGEILLTFSANQLTVKILDFISRPYRVEFNYLTGKSRYPAMPSSIGASDYTDEDDFNAFVKSIKGLENLAQDKDPPSTNAQVKTILEGFFDAKFLSDGTDPSWGTAAGAWTAANLGYFQGYLNQILPYDTEVAIVADVVLFDFTNTEIAKITVFFDGDLGTLTVVNVKFSSDELFYKYDDTLPNIGRYTLLRAPTS